jgi:hypothetical protein
MLARVNHGTRTALTLTAQTPIPRYDFVGPDRSAGLGIGSPGDTHPGRRGFLQRGPSAARRSGIGNENILARANAGDMPSVDWCRDSPSPCRRRGSGGGAHRWTCCRNDYRGRGHRATLLSAATRLCGSRVILLLDARRAAMGWLSRRVDLSFS